MKKLFTAKTAYWKIMKLCAIQMILPLVMTCLASAHENYGQILKKRITITVKDVTLEEVLRKIEEAGDVKFYYSIDQLDVDARFSLDVTNTPLREVLDQVLSPHRIDYRVHERDGAITLKRYHGGSVGSVLMDQKLDATDKAGLVPVSGRIIDNQTALPMAGVNVIVKGTTLGTTTDADGRFTISAEEADVLVFSFIGYKTVEIEVGSQTFIELSMEEDVSALDEVVVFASGYEEISPERSTGSYTNIGQQLLQRNVGTDIFSRLNGLAPSLAVDSRGGRPLMNVRGRSTILADDQPLIVVDNFPYNGDLSTINPNDIESITILRDAAAASIWGVRAGNGVIVITTKKGVQNRPLQIAFNANVTTGDVPDLYYESRMSASDFIDVESMLFANGYYNGAVTDARMPPLTPAVEIMLDEREGRISPAEAESRLNDLRNNDFREDLEEHFYRPSTNQQYALNLNGGGARHSFYLSGGYDKNLDSRRGNGYERVSLNSQFAFRPLERLEVDTRLVYTHSRTQADYTLNSLLGRAKDLYPYAQLTDESGKSLPIFLDYRAHFVESAVDNGFLPWHFIPIEEPAYSDNSQALTNIRSATSLKYGILKSLNIEMRYQYELQEVAVRDFNSEESYFARDMVNQYSVVDPSGMVTGTNIPEGGILTLRNSRSGSHNGRVQLNFNHGWKRHRISALSGAEIRETEVESFSNRLYGYDANLGSAIPVDFSSSFVTYPNLGYGPIPGFHAVGGTIDRFRSVFGNAAYTFDERYTASVSARIDQSNLFGVKTNQRSAPLWSVGGKWMLSNEKFFTSDRLSSLAIRVTYGHNGNTDRNVTAFTTARFLSAQWSRRNAARITAPPNPSLRWERISMLNLGLDFGLVEDVITGSVEYYSKTGDDLIGLSELDPTVGFASFRGNVASIKGHGWDVQLNAVPLNRSFRWTSNLLFSYTIDEVTAFPVKPSSLSLYFVDSSIERTSTVDYAPHEGRPLFSIYSHRWAGLDPDSGQPRGYLNGAPSSDFVAIGNAADVDSLVYHGPALPPFFGSLRNTFQFKGLSLSFNIVYRFGHFFRAPSISYSSLFTNHQTHGDFAHRWKEPGDEVNTNVPAMTYPADAAADAFYLRSEVLVNRGDNIRLQDVQVQYDFKPFTVGKAEIGSLALYAYVNNVGILWKANDVGIDPDFPSMPSPRTWSIGFRSSF